MIQNISDVDILFAAEVNQVDRKTFECDVVLSDKKPFYLSKSVRFYPFCSPVLNKGKHNGD